MSGAKLNKATFAAVNIGCGPRFLPSGPWLNFDFHSRSSSVRSCNLLGGIPLADNSVDLVYSSHVLEHFSRNQAKFLVEDMYRLLRPGGFVRIVVPDLEDICRNYLQSLSDLQASRGRDKHAWAVVELIDQMVRTTPGGEMVKMHRKALMNGDELMREHIRMRTGFDVGTMNVGSKRSVVDKLSNISFSILGQKAMAMYVALVKKLLPAGIRDLVIDGASPGEKHKWMYDRPSLEALLIESGFNAPVFHAADTSDCSEFLVQNLDLNEDGSPYKASSLYVEARK